jgi:hypothetical protein
MNPRDFDPDITRIVDELRGAGGIITGLFIRRADGTCIGKPPEPDSGLQVSGEMYERMRLYAATPPPTLQKMPEPATGKLKPQSKRRR